MNIIYCRFAVFIKILVTNINLVNRSGIIEVVSKTRFGCLGGAYTTVVLRSPGWICKYLLRSLGVSMYNINIITNKHSCNLSVNLVFTVQSMLSLKLDDMMLCHMS